MVKWADVNLHWADVNSLSIEVGNKNGERYIILNGHKHTRQSLEKNKPSSLGGTRMHLFGLDFVIKVDSPKLYKNNWMSTSFKQSNAEYEVWKNIEKKDRKYFAEVIAYEKNKYIVFRRYLDIDDINTPLQKIRKRHINKVESLTTKYDICDVNTGWYKGHVTHNWCLVDGKPLIFDYGFSDVYE